MWTNLRCEPRLCEKTSEMLMPQYWSSSKWRGEVGEGWKTNGPPQLPSPPLGRPRLRKWSLLASCKWRSFDAPNCAWNSHWSSSMRGFPYLKFGYMQSVMILHCTSPFPASWPRCNPLAPCQKQNPPHNFHQTSAFSTESPESGKMWKVKSGPVESHFQAPARRFTDSRSSWCQSLVNQSDDSSTISPSSTIFVYLWWTVKESLSSLIILISFFAVKVKSVRRMKQT